MKVKLHLDQEELKELVEAEFERKLGASGRFDPKQIKIETKSRQNYRSEWEEGAGYRATYEAEL